MKLTRMGLRLAVAALVALGIQTSIVNSDAQQVVGQRRNQRRNVAATANPVSAAHHTFEQAARIMEGALPIYDGHRHRAIELAKMAGKEIEEAIHGTAGTGNIGAGTAPRLSAAQRAALVKRGANVSLSRYSAAQISASNLKMQQGIQLLQQALSQVQAGPADIAGHMSDAATFGTEAVQAANKGLQFIASR